MKIRIFSKNNEYSESIRNEFEQLLVSNKYELTNKSDYDLAVSIGGDGHFIKMLHECNFDTSKKYVGINTGNLGFMNSILADNLMEFIKDLNTNNLNVEKVKFLTVKINSKDEYDGTTYNAINEVILRNTLLTTLHISTFINKDKLNDMAGDGVLISTPVGSTAHSMSLGGAIIDNNVGALQIIPIAPINSAINKNIRSPFITSDKNRIIFKPINKDNSISVIIDGRIIPIKDLVSIEITAKEELDIIRDVEYNNIINLNNKIYK